MKDILIEIWSSVKRNKLRTALTGFSVAWGIFMIILLLGAGNGLINGLTHNTDNFLSNSMEVYGGTTSKAYHGMREGRSITLDDSDLRTTRHQYGDIVETLGAGISQGGVTITASGGNYVSSTLNGVSPNQAVINKIQLLAGRFINDIDERERRKVLVIGDTQARELVGGDVRSLVGQSLRVGNFAFEVIGISKADESGMGEDVYAPFTTIRAMYGRGDKADKITFSFHGLNTEAENDAFEKRYKASLGSNHDAAPDDNDAIWIFNRFTQSLQMDEGMRIIRTALWVVGILTLLSGIVGVSNIMLISVRERTREFGIRKAIGATPFSILRLIITESIIITTFFGYIGMLLGIAANQYMNATIGHETVDLGFETGTGTQITTFLNPTVGLDVCIEATIVMIVAGTIAGLIPARKAAWIKPIEALQSE
jgi:putative ABC transport system permease protein